MRIAIAVVVMVLMGCGGPPSEEDVEARLEKMMWRTTDMSSEAECRARVIHLEKRVNFRHVTEAKDPETAMKLLDELDRRLDRVAREMQDIRC